MIENVTIYHSYLTLNNMVEYLMVILYDLLCYIKNVANLLNVNYNYFHMIIIFNEIGQFHYDLRTINLSIRYTIADLKYLLFYYFKQKIIVLRNLWFYSWSRAIQLFHNFHSFFGLLSCLLLLLKLMDQCHHPNIFIIRTLFL